MYVLRSPVVLFSSNEKCILHWFTSFSGHNLHYLYSFCVLLNEEFFRSVFRIVVVTCTPEELNDRQETTFSSTSLWTEPGCLLAPQWNVKCTFDCRSPQSRSLRRWPSAGHSCPSFAGQPCSTQFSASFVTPALSSEVIGHILYLAANLPLTCNMQMLFIRCWACSCCPFESPADFTWLNMPWCEGLEWSLELPH